MDGLKFQLWKSHGKNSKFGEQNFEIFKRFFLGRIGGSIESPMHVVLKNICGCSWKNLSGRFLGVVKLKMEVWVCGVRSWSGGWLGQWSPGGEKIFENRKFSNFPKSRGMIRNGQKWCFRGQET